MFKRALIAVLLIGIIFPALIQAQGTITVTPNRDYINVRLWPAIGATVIGSMGPADTATATGRSVDGEWVRIDYLGREGWVGRLVVNVSGDVNTLPLADPRTIPYNSNAAPSAGGGSPAGALKGRLEYSGAALRAGPSTAYPILQNLPRYAEFPVTGRVASNDWIQVTWEGLVGWLFLDNITLFSDSGATINDVPVVPPASDTGARLTDANARDKFLVVDQIRRTLDQARATLDVIEPAWQSLRAGIWPQVCSAPPLMERFFLNSTDRNAFPDLIEAVLRLNQGLNDLNNAVQWYLDACLAGPNNATGQAIAGGPPAIQSARAAFDEVLFRITGSYTVQLQGIHAHLNFAQDQFERIEAIWLDVRLGVTGEPPCVNLPQQPPDYALTAWEQQHYPQLIPLVNRMNEGLAVLRQSIAVWQTQCNGFTRTPGYVMPVEAGTNGYNLMLQAREIFNDVRSNYLVPAYGDPGYLVPAMTSTPDPTIQAILHAPYTPTFTATPTPGFQYSVSGMVIRSELHPACQWFGIAGQVRNGDGSPRPATLVHVFGPGLDRYILSGSDPRYGPAGFEVAVRADAAQLNTWTARIEDGFGNPLSPDQSIRFADGCEMNVAMLTFDHH